MNETIINGAIAIGGVLIANYGFKLGKAYDIVKSTHAYIEAEIAARKDGILTEKEKAKLYDKIVEGLKEAWSILKGLFPNRSKV